MAAPWWEYATSEDRKTRLMEEYAEITRGHPPDSPEEVGHALRNIFPPPHVRVSKLQRGYISATLRTMMRSNGPDVWSEIYRWAKMPVLGKNGHNIPLEVPFNVAGFYEREDKTDEKLAHFIKLGFVPELRHQQFISKWRRVYPQTYAALFETPWTVATHHTFSVTERHVLFTVLLCAKRLRPRLPPEIWLLIFEHLTRRDLRPKLPRS